MLRMRETFILKQKLRPAREQNVLVNKTCENLRIDTAEWLEKFNKISGAQFTCFTGTKGQTLTLREELEKRASLQGHLLAEKVTERDDWLRER